MLTFFVILLIALALVVVMPKSRSKPAVHRSLDAKRLRAMIDTLSANMSETPILPEFSVRG